MTEENTPPISRAQFKAHLEFIRKMRDKDNEFVDDMRKLFDEFLISPLYFEYENELLVTLREMFYDHPEDSELSDLDYYVYECEMGKKEGVIYLEEDEMGNPAETIHLNTDDDIYDFLVRQYPERRARALEAEEA